MFGLGSHDQLFKAAELQEKSGITTNASVNMVINERIMLCGFEQIRDGLFSTMDKIISEPDKSEP